MPKNKYKIVYRADSLVFQQGKVNGNLPHDLEKEEREQEGEEYKITSVE